MAECIECGRKVDPEEHFCGTCGTQQPHAGESAAEVREVQSSRARQTSLSIQDSQPSIQVSLGGSSTGQRLLEDEPVPEKHTTGGHKPQVKQLESGTLLNSRYEIVRRIGGGGMGAVYLAKDRNLGDAPRAVKEMVESHLDEIQHEKAIGDFKRESLLLTSLEHPSIPTIYDYFYDSAAGRFYLVMKYISGGDLASRLRSSTGNRVDEKTVADWGMQV